MNIKEFIQKQPKKVLLKWVGLAVLIVLFWYISIPIVISKLIWKKTKLSTKNKYIVIILFCFLYFSGFGIFVSMTGDKKQTSENMANQNQQISKPLTEEEIALKKKQELDDLKALVIKNTDELKNYKGMKRDSVDNILLEVMAFPIYKDLIDKAKISESTEIQTLGKELEKTLIAVKTREMPILRKKYGEVVDKEVWISDASANVHGTNNTTITLVSSLFASNKNIATIQATIGDTLKALGFKRAEYMWYEDAYDYDYYNIESAKDSEL